VRDKAAKLAIAGAGITGAYLFRILKREGCEAHLFDRESTTRCGLTPCAWGTSKGFCELVERAGLDPARYILQRLDHVIIDDIRIKADLMVFDKPRLIRDLLGDATVHLTPLPLHRYERVIDATGTARALLPPIKDDIVLGCRQYLVKTVEPLENRIKLGGIGYAWCFPLSGNLYHIGCGSLLADPQRILKNLDWLESGSARHGKEIICSCTGKIRLTGPHRSQPFVIDDGRGEIRGVGEAIGCVAPLAGDGVVPGMKSVHLLLHTWDKPQQYTEDVLDEFRWMEDERGVIDTLRKSGRVGIGEARVLRSNSKRMGMQVGLRDAVDLLKNLR
jgi:hypothetical protein